MSVPFVFSLHLQNETEFVKDEVGQQESPLLRSLWVLTICRRKAKLEFSLPIVRRFREKNLSSDNELPETERKEIMFRPLPDRSHLLANIALLREKSSSKKLDNSKRLIEKSRQIIFENGAQPYKR